MIIQCEVPWTKKRKTGKGQKPQYSGKREQAPRPKPVYLNPPNQKEVVSYGIRVGLSPQTALKAYLHYAKLGWMTVNGKDIYDWRSSIEKWVKK